MTPKGGAKSVRRVKNSGTGRRLAPKTLRGRARARVFDGASAARSSSRLSAMRSLLCASRNNDLLRFEFLSSHLAGFRPAGSHREKSGSSDDTCAESERRVKFCWGYLGGIREISYLSAYGNTDIPEIPLHRRRRLGCGVPTLRSFVPSVRAP